MFSAHLNWCNAVHMCSLLLYFFPYTCRAIIVYHSIQQFVKKLNSYVMTHTNCLTQSHLYIIVCKRRTHRIHLSSKQWNFDCENDSCTYFSLCVASYSIVMYLTCEFVSRKCVICCISCSLVATVSLLVWMYVYVAICELLVENTCVCELQLLCEKNLLFTVYWALKGVVNGSLPVRWVGLGQR